ncbi:acetyltransferase [Natronosporangium hydrolyticum]|uniref:Lysine N-acyltransferase MbtK n=1 Tax=Natronosporangium hydrolyticum TaxID=2811111 RepID=A0A895YBW1_9ACTN|nr:GNAT family N-acetyltransferase [Natronosporangium hydrolyticum]QSB12809.1 acetyltransferase [Natronosporangium hydrolyticum]
MTTVYSEKLPELGEFRLTPLDPDRHLDLVAQWVREPRARFWGMTALRPDQIREIYSFLASLDSHHAYLMRLDDQPVGIFQTYRPAADPVGEHYPVQPGDLGIHLFLAAPATAPIAGFTGALAAALTRYLFADPAVARLVVEPDVRNEPALRRWRRLGFRFGPVIDLPEKRAQLAFLHRAEAITSKS